LGVLEDAINYDAIRRVSKYDAVNPTRMTSGIAPAIAARPQRRSSRPFADRASDTALGIYDEDSEVKFVRLAA